jgi:TctA family transporter
VATAIVAVFSQPLVKVAGSFQSPDYFGLLVFGMVAAVVLAQGSVVRSVAMVVLGLFLGLIGTDIASGKRVSPLASRRSPTALVSCRWRWGCSALPR